MNLWSRDKQELLSDTAHPELIAGQEGARVKEEARHITLGDSGAESLWFKDKVQIMDSNLCMSLKQ